MVPIINQHERTVLQATAYGMTTSQIALRLKVHQQTVKNHLTSIRVKYKARNTNHAIFLAICHNEIHHWHPPAPTDTIPPVDINVVLKHRQSRIALSICSWCLREATDFKDPTSAKEYLISGLCQPCQNQTFNIKEKNQ